jgi:hypothetical protein
MYKPNLISEPAPQNIQSMILPGPRAVTNAPTFVYAGTSTAKSTSTHAGSSISDMIGVIRSSGTVSATSATENAHRDQPSYAAARRLQRVRRGPEVLTFFEAACIVYEDLVVARAVLGRANRD